MVHLRRELFPNAFCCIWVHLLVEVHADSVSKSWRWLTIISWSTKHPLTHSAPSSASASLADQHLAFTINNISSPLPPWISSISCSSLLVLMIFNIVETNWIHCKNHKNFNTNVDPTILFTELKGLRRRRSSFVTLWVRHQLFLFRFGPTRFELSIFC